MATPSAPLLPPAFTTAAGCRAWLDSAPLADPLQAQASLLGQLGRLNRYLIAPPERLAILEMLEKPVVFAQEECQRRFAGRPLPLAAGEQAVFESCRQLWLGVAEGYRLCLEGSEGAEGVADPDLVLLRGLKHLAAAQVDIYRASHRPGAGFWRLAHDFFAAAERLGLAERPVAGEPGNATPLAVYGTMLLLQAASPNELSQRQLAWVTRWAQRWGAKLKVSATPLGAGERAVPLCVDLQSDRPAGYQPGAGAGVRWLDTADLRRSVSSRLALLERGESPAKLQLGQDCAQPACGELLGQTYRRWCKGGIPRRHERHAVDGPCAFVSGVEAIHYYLSGRKPFRPPGYADSDQLRREREEIATFGRIATRHDEDYSRQQGFRVEQWEMLPSWEMVNESATGVLLGRPPGDAGSRVAIGQLVAVQPPGARGLLLGSVRWACADDDGRINAGVMTFPGQPETVAVRSTGLAAVNEKYRQAFLLPPVPALAEPATAIVPFGWFKRDRILEVFTDRAWQIRLTELVDRGTEFDRVAYER